MTYKKYYDLIRDALEYSSAEQFISEIGYPEWAPKDADRFFLTCKTSGISRI